MRDPGPGVSPEYLVKDASNCSGAGPGAGLVSDHAIENESVFLECFSRLYVNLCRTCT